MEELKALEKIYQVAMDWYYREKLTKQEYLDNIGKYKDYTPEEIVNVICKKIKEL